MMITSTTILYNKEIKHATCFEPRTATESELFSYLTYLGTTTFVLLSISFH